MRGGKGGKYNFSKVQICETQIKSRSGARKFRPTPDPIESKK
jgi:hypothetical protein